MKTVMSEKGQITIPKRARELLGLRPTDRLDVEVLDGELRMRKHVDEDPIDQCFGMLSLDTGVDEFLHTIRGTS
jgi:AbrB family looped-hinge helix DNA binding protein